MESDSHVECAGDELVNEAQVLRHRLKAALIYLSQVKDIGRDELVIRMARARAVARGGEVLL